MGLFNWLFGTGDYVKDKSGKRVKVIRHEAEGMVLVRDDDGKHATVFGGNLAEVEQLTDNEALDYMAHHS